MRKAFSANVSKARPKTRLGALLASPQQQETAPPPEEITDISLVPAPEEIVATETDEPGNEEIMALEAEIGGLLERALSKRKKSEGSTDSIEAGMDGSLYEIEHREEERTPLFPERPEPFFFEPPQDVTSAASTKAHDEKSDDRKDVIEDSKIRRARLKERIKAATSPVTVSQPTPQTAMEARTSALSLIAALRQELEEVKTLNVTLIKDLEQTRNELTRAAEEARSRTEEANRMASEVKDRAQLLNDLGLELTSLEAERNDVLVELRGARNDFSTLKQAYAELEQKVTLREAELAETLGEEERLAADLEFQVEAQRRSEKALRAVQQERDMLARQVEELTTERADLIESQRALDEIHRALADARSRIL